jgi:hypothetical protein
MITRGFPAVAKLEHIPSAIVTNTSFLFMDSPRILVFNLGGSWTFASIHANCEITQEILPPSTHGFGAAMRPFRNLQGRIICPPVW